MENYRGESLAPYLTDEFPSDESTLFDFSATGDPVPFRGPFKPTINREEYENLRILKKSAHVDVFDVSDPQQRERYQGILNDILAGKAELIRREMNPSEMQVYIEWLERYYELPPSFYTNYSR